jgi:hypothetical protein
MRVGARTVGVTRLMDYALAALAGIRLADDMGWPGGHRLLIS